MCDYICPHCKEDQYFLNEDGRILDENNRYEITCSSCKKTLKYRVSYDISYEIMCDDGDHDLEPYCIDPPVVSGFICKNCNFYEISDHTKKFYTIIENLKRKKTNEKN